MSVCFHNQALHRHELYVCHERSLLPGSECGESISFCLCWCCSWWCRHVVWSSGWLSPSVLSSCRCCCCAEVCGVSYCIRPSGRFALIDSRRKCGGWDSWNIVVGPWHAVICPLGSLRWCVGIFQGTGNCVSPGKNLVVDPFVQIYVAAGCVADSGCSDWRGDPMVHVGRCDRWMMILECCCCCSCCCCCYFWCCCCCCCSANRCMLRRRCWTNWWGRWVMVVWCCIADCIYSILVGKRYSILVGKGIPF